MTGDPALLFHLQHDHIRIAIQANLAHHLHMTGLFALVPQLFARTRPIHRLATTRGFRQRLAIHPRHHQHAAAVMVLRDDRHQTVGVPCNAVEPVGEWFRGHRTQTRKSARIVAAARIMRPLFPLIRRYPFMSSAHPIEKLRNVAIIAHVDHGKTTLVDKLLKQSGTLDRRAQEAERVMDSNDQEKERGITILAKNTGVDWNGYRINIVDTPGHADFGGEVERVLSMVDSVLLLVDAFDGPMPQTRFVTKKAFEHGLRPIVVINKVDRPGARPHWVMDQVFELFDKLGATDEQLDFPVIYASALNGVAGLEVEALADDMTPLFQMIVDRVPAPSVDLDGAFQMQISALDYNSYVGVIGIGRIKRGKIKPGSQVKIISIDGKVRQGKLLQVMGHLGLNAWKWQKPPQAILFVSLVSTSSTFPTPFASSIASKHCRRWWWTSPP